MGNKPRIRFKGFTEDWEQRKLDDIAKIKTGGGTPKTANPEYWSGNIPWIQSSDLVEGDIVHVNINKFINNNALKNSAAKLISRDSIALVTRVGVGKVAVINQDFTTSQDFLSLSDFDGSDIKFLAYQLYRLMQENAKVLQGTSIKGITKTELIEQSISIPSLGQEQNLISNLLSKIDSIITLHQCKLEKLKLTKKALLQKLFPKNGKYIPEIRFKGFTDAWEQRKLDELTIFIGDGLHGTPKYDENGSYYFINGNNLVDNKVSFTEETKKVAFEALGNDDRRLDSTAILMSINGTIGTLARYNNENIMLGKSVAYITPKNINRDFLFYQLQGNVIQSYFYKNLTGTTIKNLGLGTIKNTIVMSTLSEEESTIGRFFYKLDQYITLHQRKLERLQEVKKGLLQKMFV